jgi:hypothetical protein
MKRNGCYLPLFLMLIFALQACSASRQVLISGSLPEINEKKMSIGSIKVESPQKNEFIFEAQYMWRNQKYQLGNDTAPLVRDEILSLFDIINTSPYHVDVSLDFNCEILQVEFAENSLGMKMIMNLKVMKGDKEVYHRKYQSVNTKWYPTGFDPFPKDEVITNLFMMSLNDIIKSIGSDEKMQQLQ